MNDTQTTKQMQKKLAKAKDKIDEVAILSELIELGIAQDISVNPWHFYSAINLLRKTAKKAQKHLGFVEF